MGHVRVEAGTHALEVRDVRGGVVATAHLVVHPGSHGFVYAPERDPRFCFVVEGGGKDPSTTPLDPARDLWEMQSGIDRWFARSDKSAKERAVHMERCGGS
jgi:hypothetical protein